MDSLFRNKCALLSTKVIIVDISILMCILVVSVMDLSIIFFAGALPDFATQSLSCYRTEIKCAILQYNQLAWPGLALSIETMKVNRISAISFMVSKMLYGGGGIQNVYFALYGHVSCMSRDLAHSGANSKCPGQKKEWINFIEIGKL